MSSQLTRSQITAKARQLARRGLTSTPEPVKQAIRRNGRRVLGALGETGAASGDGPVWVSPPAPLPDGMSRPELEKTFRSWSVNGEPVGHLDGYIDDSILRFSHTWGLVRHDTGRALELGSNPYFTTYLLDEHSPLELTLANYYGQRGHTTETVSYLRPGATARTEVSRECDLFNVEEDEFPYSDGTFDVVLFCEIIEHMLMNPLWTLRQIHRVLKPNGIMVLTTPNVARLDNVLALVNGANMYDPYSGFGPYGRHNREYTRHELHRLLEFAGFEVETSLTADGHPSNPARWPLFEQTAPLVRPRREDLGHYLFVKARAVRPPREGLPSFLYRSYPPDQIVDFA